MRLHYHPRSRCSRRVLMTARQLGVALELVVVDLFKGEQRSPAFLALNPNHRVPVLDDDGQLLWESHAIMQYLADKTPGQTLYPTEAGARADVNRWLFWNAQHFAPGIGTLNFENSIKAMLGQGAPDAAEVSRGERLVLEAGALLDAHLAGREWICGHALSLADLAIAPPLGDMARARLPLEQFAHLQRWFKQVTALEVWKATEA